MKKLTKMTETSAARPPYQKHMNEISLLCILLVCLFCFSEQAHATQIGWASAVSPNETNAAGPPDSIIVTGPTGTSTFGGFGQGAGNSVNYNPTNLATLLNVTQAVLNQADFIAFEGNGTAGITFESGAWTFSDGTNTISVNHTFGNTAAQDGPGVLALGNVNRLTYASFFGTPTIQPQGDFAYILFDFNGISAINPGASMFGATLVAPGDGSNPGTPDIDALGPMAVPEPDTVALTGIGLLILSLGRRYFRKLRPREIS